jgi:hypothetical protein
MLAEFLHRSRDRRSILRQLFVVLIGSFTITGCGKHPNTSASFKDSTVARATFTHDGSIELPIGYRQWSHVGTSVKLRGINVLDGSPIATPEVLDAYVEPGAMAQFQKTGKWPDGAQIVKEYSAVRVEKRGDDQMGMADTSMGNGISEAHYDGLGMMVKDSKRFADAPGHWAYFSFGHKLPPYDSTARLRPLQQCASCHVRIASDTDYVVSRAHIGLARNIEK